MLHLWKSESLVGTLGKKTFRDITPTSAASVTYCVITPTSALRHSTEYCDITTLRQTAHVPPRTHNRTEYCLASACNKRLYRHSRIIFKSAMFFDENGMVIATDGLEVPPPWEVRESSKFGGQYRRFPQPFLSPHVIILISPFTHYCRSILLLPPH